MKNKSSADKRSNENKELSFRSSRFYCVANEWYFSVREDEDQGPYPSKLAAENQLKKYILNKQHFKLNKIQLMINNLCGSKAFIFRSFSK